VTLNWQPPQRPNGQITGRGGFWQFQVPCRVTSLDKYTNGTWVGEITGNISLFNSLDNYTY